MKRRRELIVTDVLALVLLLTVFLLSWREEAAFGLAALVILNLLVLLRGRPTRFDGDQEK